jgi:hypothetical protein
MPLPLNPGYLMSRAGGLVMSRSVFLLPSMVDNVEGINGDTTRRFSAMTYQKSSNNTPNGDLFRMIQAHGRAKGGLMAYFTGWSGNAISTNPQNNTVNSFNVSGLTLQVAIDGGATQTITFPTGTVNSVNYTAASAGNLTKYISSVLTGAQYIEFIDEEYNRLKIRSDSFGLASSVRIVGGTGAATLGFNNVASNVASASSITLANTSNRIFPITGTTTINEISSAAWIGTATDPRPLIAVIMPGGCTLKHKSGSITASTTAGVSGPLLLQDDIDFTAPANTVVYLKYQKPTFDGNDGKFYWLEIGRSIGFDGTNDLGNGITGRQVAWLVAHQAPNNLNSAEQHEHISIETADSRGAHQTKIGILYGLDTSIVQISSAKFLVFGNPLILGGDDTQTKDIWFSVDSSTQQKSRRSSIRQASAANSHNLQFNVHDDAGVTTTVFDLECSSASIKMRGALQKKRSTVNTASASTITLDSFAGNTFPVTGTATINYITTTNWQSGSEIALAFTSTPTMAHNTGSVPANTAALLLQGGQNWVGDAGANITFRYNGTNWVEIARTSFVGSRTSLVQLLGASGVTSYSWANVPAAETIVDSAVHAPLDLTGARQFRLSLLLGAAPTQALGFRAYVVDRGNVTTGTTLTNYTLLGSTGSNIDLTIGTGGMYIGPWETIAEAAKGTNRAVGFTGRNGTGAAAQTIKGVWFEYR